MNKHYDKYLCRVVPHEWSVVHIDRSGRRYVWAGRDKFFLSKPYTLEDVEIRDLSPVEQFEQGQMEGIKFVFKFYGWVFAGIFALATALFIGFSLK